MRPRWRRVLLLLLTLPLRAGWGLVAGCALLLTAEDRDSRGDAHSDW
jgi:hypothetical protein